MGRSRSDWKREEEPGIIGRASPDSGGGSE